MSNFTDYEEPELSEDDEYDPVHPLDEELQVSELVYGEIQTQIISTS